MYQSLKNRRLTAKNIAETVDDWLHHLRKRICPSQISDATAY